MTPWFRLSSRSRRGLRLLWRSRQLRSEDVRCLDEVKTAVKAERRKARIILRSLNVAVREVVVMSQQRTVEVVRLPIEQIDRSDADRRMLSELILQVEVCQRSHANGRLEVFNFARRIIGVVAFPFGGGAVDLFNYIDGQLAACP